MASLQNSIFLLEEHSTREAEEPEMYVAQPWSLQLIRLQWAGFLRLQMQHQPSVTHSALVPEASLLHYVLSFLILLLLLTILT